MPRALALTLAAVLCSGALVGCSGEDQPRATLTPTPTASASQSAGAAAGEAAYLPVPDGVTLTAQGTQLQTGESAVVAWEPRQGLVGVLDISVDRLEKTTFKKSFVGWDLDKDTLKTTPYFVRATATNMGDTDLGGRAVPLYLVDQQNTLIEATSFQSTFKPCEPGAFPKKFRPGDSLKACLVYLAPDKGALAAVSFRPTQEFDPILWTGDVKAPKPPTKKGKGSGGKG